MNMAEAIAGKLKRMGFSDLQPKEQVFYGKIDCTEETEESEEIEEIKEKEETEESQEIEEIDELPSHVWDGISKVILTCAVGSDGNTNGPLFDLARKVRGREDELGKEFPLTILRQVIERWQSANALNPPDKDYLITFLGKLSLLRFPAERVLVNAFSIANAQSPPSRLKGFSSGYLAAGLSLPGASAASWDQAFFLRWAISRQSDRQTDLDAFLESGATIGGGE